MKKGQLITFALIGFLIGIVVIVFLQVLSGRNINLLIEGNKNLTRELEIQNELRRIETNLLALESDVRGAVISEDPVFLKNVEANITAIDLDVSSLENLLRSGNTADEVKRLDVLVHEKIRFSRTILDAFYRQGKEGAEQVINSGRGRILRDSIVLVINNIDSIRQTKAKDIAGSIEQSGQRARTWGFVLAALACLLVVLAFWYIVNQSQQQLKVIQTLNESERQIKEAALMKEQFMANMSHEIRTPMNAIIGFTNLLRRTPLDATQREYVQNIHSAGDNLLALVNDILDLSKIEAGMVHLEETRFSLRSLTASVGAMFVEKVNQKGLRLQIDIEENVPDILSGDAVRLTQVLVNLISNAVKFTEQGEVRLHVEQLYQQESRVGLHIAVSDTGIGIAPDKQSAIFERFQQAETETTRRYGGTGLGLSIVKQLVELQGGSVSVESVLGEGSTFHVKIEYRIPEISEVQTAALIMDHEPLHLEQHKILIAEDNSMNQQLMRHLMKAWGFDFTIVATGNEAIKELKENNYLLVLMDIQMPQMDGYLTTSVIRNELKLNIPIIAMTAHAMMGEKEKCLQLGMNDYISKPIKETELFNLIAKYAQLSAVRETNRQKVQASSFRYLKLDYLRQLSGNDAQFEKEMMQQFVLQIPEELAQLEKALTRKDFVQVRKTAHTLKSTVGYMGLAEELHPHLEQIEQAGQQQNEALVAENLEPVKLITQEAISEVNELLQRL